MMADLPDTPIPSKDQDHFGRSRLASSIAELISHAPAGSSLRIGVYGEWGEGKTSLLKMIEERLAQSGHCCVWVTPWLGKSTEDIWDQLIRSVAGKLDMQTRKYTEAQSAAHHVQTVRSAAATGNWATKMIEGVFGEKLKESMEVLAKAQQSALLDAISDTAGDKKIVIFVDDLDRTDQALVPQLLMSLREIFDFPDFYYLLALSPKVIESGLRHVGFGGEQPHRFLEKIVELPIQLPPLDDKAVSRFIASGIDAIRDDVHLDALRDIVPFMPRNPRRIKLFLRYLASLNGELQRYRDDEVSWRTLYLAQMLRLEFPDSVRALASDEQALSDLQYGLSKQRTQRLAGIESAPEHNEEKHAPADPEAKARFMALCAAIREEGSILSGRYSLRDMLELIERPPVLTLKEIDSFFAAFMAATSPEEQVVVVERFIGKDEAGQLDGERAEAVFEASLLIRQSALEQAIQAETRDELLEHASVAVPATRLLSLQIGPMDLFGRQTLSADSWINLYKHGLEWARFSRQRDFATCRSDERDLIRDAARRLPVDVQLAILERRPFEAHHRFGGEAATFVGLGGQLEGAFTDNVVAGLLAAFEQPDGVDRFWAIDLRAKGKWLLFQHDSPFHEPGVRRQLFRIARRARVSPIVHKNFLGYLRMLGYGAFEGGSFPMRECQALLRDAGFVKPLWKAALARPLNPRTAGTLRGYRKLVLQLGVAESDLALPKWWRHLEHTFFSAASDVDEPVV